jgi:hypothetical protein
MANKKTTPVAQRDRILAQFEELGIQLAGDQFDELLAKSQQTACSHLEFLDRVLSPLADQRRQRSIERRIHQARFRDEAATLEAFDWQFNRSIDRVQIDELATADFVRRRPTFGRCPQSRPGGPEWSGEESHHPIGRPTSVCRRLPRPIHHQRGTASRVGRVAGRWDDAEKDSSLLTIRSVDH